MVKQYITTKRIDLFWTALWFKHSPYDTPTCQKLSIDKGKKIKYLLNLLLTTDVLHRNYPNLIQPLRCFQCSVSPETNLHLWHCKCDKPNLSMINIKHI